jgi:hypothetical protein
VSRSAAPNPPSAWPSPGNCRRRIGASPSGIEPALKPPADPGSADGGQRLPAMRRVDDVELQVERLPHHPASQRYSGP